MSKLVGLFLLIAGGLLLSVLFHPPAEKAFAKFQVRYECRQGQAEACSKFAEGRVRKGDLATATAAFEANCKANDLKSCYRLAQVFERQEDIERANLYYEFSCQSGYKGACETYGQFLAGPAVGKIDGVPSMKVACSGGESEACAFVAAAAYASGNNREAYSYWAHICQKLGQTNVCLWGARKFTENGQNEYSLALQNAACLGGYQQSCEIVQEARASKARLIQAELEAKVMEQKRALASLKSKKASVPKGVPTKLPPKKRR